MPCGPLELSAAPPSLPLHFAHAPGSHRGVREALGRVRSPGAARPRVARRERRARSQSDPPADPSASRHRPRRNYRGPSRRPGRLPRHRTTTRSAGPLPCDPRPFSVATRLGQLDDLYREHQWDQAPPQWTRPHHDHTGFPVAPSLTALAPGETGFGLAGSRG
jgi:hypothetical protein